MLIFLKTSIILGRYYMDAFQFHSSTQIDFKQTRGSQEGENGHQAEIEVTASIQLVNSPDHHHYHFSDAK